MQNLPEDLRNIFYQKDLYASGITAYLAAIGNEASCKIYKPF